MKKPLLERFQQLAGIKPLYEMTEGACYGEDGKPMPEAHCMEENIDEQIDPGTAIAAVSGMLGMISAAGGLAAINIAMENPETKEKHPKLAAFLDLLDGLGKGASSAKRGGSVAGGPNEDITNEQVEDEEPAQDEPTDEELAAIEDALEDMF